MFYLRNKFHFSDIHQSMNTMGHMQSKWRRKGITVALHGTHWDECHKSVIHLVFTLHFYIVLFVTFYCKCCKIHDTWWRKVINQCVWLLRWTAVSMKWRQLNVTSANQFIHLSMRSLVCNITATIVVHRCMNLAGPKRFIQDKSLVVVNIFLLTYVWYLVINWVQIDMPKCEKNTCT